jgi:hypothetical protein
MARETGLEPAASAVTGRRSNQLSYSRNPTDSSAGAACRGWTDTGAPGVRQSLSRQMLELERFLSQFHRQTDESAKPDAAATYSTSTDPIGRIARQEPLNGHPAL